MTLMNEQAPLSWQTWCDERAGALDRVRLVDAAFPGPYKRERPRDPNEAALLRKRGVPAELVGPVTPAPRCP